MGSASVCMGSVSQCMGSVSVCMGSVSTCMASAQTDLNMTCKRAVCGLLWMLTNSLSTGPCTLVSPVDPLVGGVEAVQVVASIQDSSASCQLKYVRAQLACGVDTVSMWCRGKELFCIGNGCYVDLTLLEETVPCVQTSQQQTQAVQHYMLLLRIGLGEY